MDNRKMFYGAPPEIFAKAKMLRDNMTEEEKILWSELRANKLNGIRFKPQHPISYFIADFYCHKAKLVVEIDGKSHDEINQRQYDIDRTLIFESFGIKIIRFKNSEVKDNLNDVLSTIHATASGLIEKNQSSAPALKGEIDFKTAPNSSLQGVEGKNAGLQNQSSAPALKGEIDLKTVLNSSLQGVEGKNEGSQNQPSTPALKRKIDFKTVPISSFQAVEGKDEDSQNQSSTPALKRKIDFKTVPNSSLQGVEGKKGGIT